jgi:hypothetical protein
MAKINRTRLTADIDGEFVVFIIGMRPNKLWKVHKWLPVALAMGRMLGELSKRPESGFLGSQTFGALGGCIVQYWRSWEQLEAYAQDRNSAHWPAWVAFNKRVASNGDVGIWHETYRVAPGAYECVYNNVPDFGLGKATRLVPASGYRETASGRMSAGVKAEERARTEASRGM